MERDRRPFRENKKKIQNKETIGRVWLLEILAEEEEDCIISFIIDAKDKKKPLSTSSVINYADTIKYEYTKKSIKTKLRWCYRFIKRYGFSIHRISQVGQAIPENMKDIKTSFIKEVIKLKRNLIYFTMNPLY